MKKSLFTALSAIMIAAPLALVSTAAEAKPVKKHHHVKKHKVAKHHRVAAPQQ
ncbi:MAG TPA: hypothetical protein VFW68_09825 [Rhodocyclaceae bacterium]|nr:hypothetical protein [Rhodocyclaceae bacterium]